MKVTLFLPPCSKARPRVTKHGTYMPEAYMNWRTRFAQQWHNCVPQMLPFTEPVEVVTSIYTKTGNMRQDADNVHAAILDALQDVQCIKNDRLVQRGGYSSVQKSKTPRIEIVINLIGNNPIILL